MTITKLSDWNIWFVLIVTVQLFQQTFASTFLLIPGFMVGEGYVFWTVARGGLAIQLPFLIVGVLEMVVWSFWINSARAELGNVMIRVGVETLSYSIHRWVSTRHHTIHVALLWFVMMNSWHRAGKVGVVSSCLTGSVIELLCLILLEEIQNRFELTLVLLVLERFSVELSTECKGSQYILFHDLFLCPLSMAHVYLFKLPSIHICDCK